MDSTWVLPVAAGLLGAGLMLAIGSLFGRSVSATRPSPAAPSRDRYWQAVVGQPAGRFGPYWQEIARCGHEHPTPLAAWECASRDPHFADLPEGLLGIAPA